MEEMTIKFLLARLSELSVRLSLGSFPSSSAMLSQKMLQRKTVDAKTDLLEKDIQHMTKELASCENKFAVLHKRISDLRDSTKEIYVSKELFHQTIKQLNEKLDTILKFVEK